MRGPADVARLGNVNVVSDARIVRDDVEKLFAALERANKAAAPALQDADHRARLFGSTAVSVSGTGIATNEHAVFVQGGAGRIFRDGNFFETRFIGLQKAPSAAGHADATRDKVGIERSNIALVLDPGDLTLLFEGLQELLQC